MRVPVLVLSIAVVASTAAAQTADLDRLRMDNLRQNNMRAEEQTNLLRRNDADVRQAIADQQRRQTQANARELELRTAPPAAVSTAPALPSRIQSDDQALRRLQDKELDASNARLRAITPAP